MKLKTLFLVCLFVFLLLSGFAVFPINARVVDPSTVGTSTSAAATSYPYQRKCFYANGLFWLFYSNGIKILYSTSSDGTTWTDGTTTIRASTSGGLFGIAFSGTHFSYVYSIQTANNAVFYRCGTPNSDGTITWSADEQTVLLASASLTYLYVDIAVSSSGYPYVSYQQKNTTDGTAYYVFVTASSANDGTWSTAASFPYQLSTTNNTGFRGRLVASGGGNITAIYCINNDWIRAKTYYNGSSWTTEAALTTVNVRPSSSYYVSAAADSANTIHIVFLNRTTYELCYLKYFVNNNTMAGDAVLKSSLTSSSAPVISVDQSTGNLYVFWLANSTTSNHVYYTRWINGTGWDAVETDWINEVALTANDVLTCFSQAYNNYIGIEYMNATASPYQIRFGYFSLAVTDTTSPTYSSISTNTTLANNPSSFNCLVNDDTNVSTYIFSTNNTGTWTNDSATIFSNFFNTTAAWANVTKTLNDTIGNVVSYLWYANDTNDNWSNSEQVNLTVRERPNLQVTPDNVTCRKYLETFTVQINVTNAVNIQAFNFTLYYDPSLLNCSSVTSGELAGAFAVTFDTANGILEGKMAGSPINGNRWLLNITFQAAEGLIWKEGLANTHESRVWFRQAEFGFSDNSTLQYVEGGVNQINVNQLAYTFLPIRGDVNNDGTVNIQDIRTVAAYYGKTIADPEWPEAAKYDLTSDNTIDIFDLILVATNFGFTYP